MIIIFAKFSTCGKVWRSGVSCWRFNRLSAKKCLGFWQGGDPQR
nr:MAG TPA: hypothetical protein [Caudoviricetes sp.]